MKRTAKIMTVMTMLISVTAAGCGTPTKPTAPRVAATSAAATSQGPISAVVLAAYNGMWSDYQQDLLTANWQNPVSVNHATGEALMDLENALAVDGHHGWIGRGAPVLHPVVKTLPSTASPATAEVVDCADLSHFLTYVAATGALKDSTPGGRHLINAGLVMRDGRWKVSTLAAGQVGSC